MPAMTGGTIGAGALGSNVVLDAVGWSSTKAFIDRVGMLAIVVALEVQAESSSVTNDTNRKALATKVLGQFSSLIPGQFAAAVLGDLTTTTAADDQVLLTRIEAVWDAVAGVL